MSKNPIEAKQLEFWERNVVPPEELAQLRPYRTLTPRKLKPLTEFTMEAVWDANVNPHDRIADALKNAAKSGELIVTVDGQPAPYDIRETVLQAIERGTVSIDEV